MKKIIIFILNFGIAGFAFGQYDYGNQWIDYTKSGKYFKFRVINESMYKITYDVLDSIVSSAGESMANIPGKKFNLYHAGKQVPLYVGDNNGVNPNILSSTDFIEFYAKMNDGVFDSNLYKQASWQNHHYTSMYNDTASYYLTWNVDTPVRIGYTVNNINPPLPPLEINHMDHVLKVDKYNLNYVRWGYNNGKPAYWSVSIPNFLPEFEEGEGRVGSNIPTLLNKNYVDYPNLFTTNVDTAGTVGQFTIKVVGKSKTGANPDHFMKVFINNVQIVDTTFDAYNVFEFTVNYDPKILQFNNKVRVEASNTGFANTIAVSYFEMKYPRPYNFFNYSKYSFAVTGTTSERYLEVDNFNARFTIPVLFDITNSLRIQGIWNASKSVWQFVLPVTGQVTSERKLFLTSQHSIDMIELKTKDFERKFFIDYTKLANQGNFIIISHPSLLDSSSGTNWVGAYKQLKSDYGDTVVVVMIDELYDQFSYGIDKHPLAVRNFINYAYDNWTIRPDNLFIIGFGLSNGEFYDYTYGPDYEMTLIPTFGTPPSDNLLVVRDNFTYTPLLGVGRLAARTPDEVRIYYEKARDYLLAQASEVQTLDEKEWMKRILHFGGGGNINEQNSFKNNLNTYKTIVEDTLFGGDVISFFKSSSDPIEHVYSDYIDSLLQSGVSLMTFFGHSAANSFDFSVDLPENYENVGKYPFILSNGCYSGNIFFDGPNISTRFVIAEDKGAIGFYSSSGLSWAKYDHDFSTEIYRNISYASYGESIGSCIRNAINTLENKSNSGILTRLTCEEFTLHGDPSIPINSHARPDYYIDDEQLSTNPAIINVKHETFEINLDITNIGRAVTDSFIVRLERKFPGNSYFEIISEKKMASTSFKDNLTFDVITEADLAMGKNEFKISVDAQDSIYELSEMNNQAIIVVYILSDDLIPVSPYEFSMVPNKDSITLIASTANAFAVKRDYVMELDTTEYFDSPLLLTKNVTQVGGLVKWKNPPMPWVDSTVYYWRTSAIIQQKASSTGDKDEDYEYNWRYSSFIYLDGSSPGWNQSHFFQYAKDDFTNVEIPYSNRQIKFVDDEKNVQVNTFNMDYYPYSSPDAIFYRLNGVKSSSITCLQYGDPILPTWPESGLTIAVFDSITGQPVPSKLGVFPYGQDGELHWCGNSSGEYSASYWRDSSINNSAATLIWRNKIKTFMDGIPTGYYVLVFTVCSDIGPFMQTWDNDMYLKFENLLGSTLVRSVQNKEPWALFGKIGSPSWTGKVEMRADSLNGLVFFNAFFTGNWTSGYITSTLIGPAGRWGDLKWGHHANGSALGDEVNIDVVGVDAEGTEFPLMFNITATDTSLANINARDYPYIKLVCNIKDDSLRSARQLDYLRVYYDPLPEAALNPAALFLLSNDSLAEGEMFDLTVAVENISKYDMDSLLIDFVNTNGSGSNSNTKNMNFPRQDSLKKWETMNVNFTYNSFSYAGKNVLFIEVNPNDDQLEQYHFNNIGFIEYNVDRDNTNPLLDVTFDGVHIADGDLVSAKPHVEIQLKDENQFLALDDTSLITMWLLYPDDENSQPVFFASNIVTFIPASGDFKKKNLVKTQIDLALVAKDGIYALLVEASDKRSNQSGNYDYKLSFEVVTNPSITNVYNYPNPFTTSTRFVFEVTGVVPPSYMKIQIMTVTGKVVKEINIDELGPLVIGQNITDYAWDGTDEFGDALANGVYLYRVVTKLDGQLLDFRASEGDEYFKTTNDKKFVGNIGKMVLIR